MFRLPYTSKITIAGDFGEKLHVELLGTGEAWPEILWNSDAMTLKTSAIAASRKAGAQIDPTLPQDERFMKLALEEAAQAVLPFGAVIVKNGEVLARGHNRTCLDRDPTAHGEMVAIHAVLSAHGPDMLRGCTLYTSGEPCCMCMGAIIWCGITRVVYAASVEQIATKLDQIMLSADDVAGRAAFASIEIRGGVLDGEAMRLFQVKSV